MKDRNLKSVVTLITVLLIVAHLVWPSLAIDGITGFLLALAILPWLSPLFKSVNLPGGLSVEYRDFEKVEQEIEKAGLTSEDRVKTKQYHPSTSDPNLILAWFRIEIEKRLRQLSADHRLPDDRSMNKLLFQLRDVGVLNMEEVAVLADLRDTLNKAIHGIQVDSQVADWALDVGPRVLAALDKKLSPNKE